MKGTMQMSDLLQLSVLGPCPARYLNTCIYSSFELVVRPHGRTPTTSYYLVLSVQRYPGPSTRGLLCSTPPERMGKWLSAATMRCSQCSGSDHMISFSGYQTRGSTLGFIHVREYLADLVTERKERLKL